MEKLLVFTICDLIVLLGYKLFGFEMCVISLLSIIAFHSFFKNKED